MALTYNQISAITEKKWLPKMYDAIFDSNPLLQRLKKKSYEKLDGGTSIMVPLNYAQTTAGGWYSGADTLDTTDNDVITAAEYSWRQLYVNISIKRDDELKNSGDAAMLNFVKNKVMIAESTMADLLGSSLFNAGTDPKAIGGLRFLIATSGTIGGIDAATYSWWQGQVDSSTTTLSISAMQTQYNAAMVDSRKPTVVVATRANYNRYYNLLQPQQRFMDSDTAKGGFESLMFNGVPVISDSHVPANHMFMLNENELHLCVHKQEDMRFEPFVKPVSQNLKVGKVYWMGNLASSNNRLHAKFSALTA